MFEFNRKDFDHIGVTVQEKPGTRFVPDQGWGHEPSLPPGQCGVLYMSRTRM